MKWLRRLFGMSNLFAQFSDDEKRMMLDWNMLYLKGERVRRTGQVPVADMTGAPDMIRRVSDAELERLIELRGLVERAMTTSGEKAIALYKKIATLAPWDEICLMTIGVEYANTGDYNEAIKWLKKALAVNPKNGQVRSNLEGVMAAAKR